MKHLDIFQNLLEDLKSGKIDYILIPCPLSVHAEILMKKLITTDIVWKYNLQPLIPTNTKWLENVEESLYALSSEIDTDKVFLQVCDINGIDRVRRGGISHVILHIYAVLASTRLCDL